MSSGQEREAHQPPLQEIQTLELLDPRMARTLAAWLDRYELGLI